MREEYKKAMDDLKKYGIGLFDQSTKKRVNPESLAVMEHSGKSRKFRVKHRARLMRDLAVIKRAYKKKFGDKSPYNLRLFEKDSALFVERMIRAVEICTLNYVLNNGGALNICSRQTITKGRENFLWEHLQTEIKER